MVYFENTCKPNDIPIYKSIIIGMAAVVNQASDTIESKRKMNFVLFSCQEKFLNLSAKSSIGETNRYEDSAIIAINTHCSLNQGAIQPVCRGNAVISNALAGVGNPLKESVCVSSMLKIAKRSAEKIAIENERKGKMSPASVFQNLYITTAGNNPKLITSARESNSFPIGEETFRDLAANPSMKSKPAAAQTK